MILGFTGTRQGMTDEQLNAFVTLFACLSPTEFHHGACVGADADAVRLIRLSLLPCRVVAHPGHSARDGSTECLSDFAARESDQVQPGQTHFARNRAIVAACDALVATPWQNAEPASGDGGGTWYTIRYARKVGKPVHVIWPDGRVEVL